jgi:hypothetical protein
MIVENVKNDVVFEIWERLYAVFLLMAVQWFIFTYAEITHFECTLYFTYVGY